MSTREDFEAWIDNPHKLNRRTEPGFTEEYEHPWTLGAWAAYQAATSRQEAKIKALVEALHMYQKAGVGSSTDYPAQWTAYTTSLLAIEREKAKPRNEAEVINDLTPTRRSCANCKFEHYDKLEAPCLPCRFYSNWEPKP